MAAITLVVERTSGWLNRCRRLPNDWECLTARPWPFSSLASIRLMRRALWLKSMGSRNGGLTTKNPIREDPLRFDVVAARAGQCEGELQTDFVELVVSA